MPSAASAPSDRALLEAIANADARAFNELVARHVDQSFRIAFRVLGHRQDAEDVVQDVFLRFWRNPACLLPAREVISFRAWLCRAVANAAIDAARRRRPAGVDDAQIDACSAPEPQPQEQLSLQQLAELLDRNIALLPLRQRTAIALVYAAHLSYRDAAATLGVTEAALASLLARARDSLRPCVPK